MENNLLFNYWLAEIIVIIFYQVSNLEDEYLFKLDYY